MSPQVSLCGIYIYCLLFQMNCEQSQGNDNDHDEASKPYPCPNVGCQMTFRYRSERSRHKKRCQYTEPEKLYEKVDGGFKCLQCLKTVKHSNNLQRHQQKCTGKRNVKDTTIKCPKCDKVFLYTSKLLEHSKVHDRKLYECTTCERVFKRKDHWTKHKCTPQVTVDDENDRHALPSMAVNSLIHTFPSAVSEDNDFDVEHEELHAISVVLENGDSDVEYEELHASSAAPEDGYFNVEEMDVGDNVVSWHSYVLDNEDTLHLDQSSIVTTPTRLAFTNSEVLDDEGGNIVDVTVVEQSTPETPKHTRQFRLSKRKCRTLDKVLDHLQDSLLTVEERKYYQNHWKVKSRCRM